MVRVLVSSRQEVVDLRARDARVWRLVSATADPSLDTPVQDAIERLHGTGAVFGSCTLELRLGGKPTCSCCDA